LWLVISAAQNEGKLVRKDCGGEKALMSPFDRPKRSFGKRKVIHQTRLKSPRRSQRNSEGFDPLAFLATIGEGRKFVHFPKKQTVFSQGGAADAVFYIQAGRVRLIVVAKTGKEATLGIIGERDFFGEGSLAPRKRRIEGAKL
jgi:CRP-like cAMP-binding protein